jgi:8-oxo-dGTP diphosphatase
MRERPAGAPRRPTSRSSAAYTIDIVLLTPLGRQLGALLVRSVEGASRERWQLPWDAPRNGEPLHDAAARIVREATSIDPAWIEQLGAFADGRRHANSASLSVAFVAVVANEMSATLHEDAAWFALSELPAIPPRQADMASRALESVRDRVDQSPIAFRLLPRVFTLSDLQQTYEMLLARRLHKASFRRALHAAWLVEPTDEWRSEGRGRPAQLFRYAPRKRRASRRGVRFDLLV